MLKLFPQHKMDNTPNTLRLTLNLYESKNNNAWVLQNKRLGEIQRAYNIIERLANNSLVSENSSVVTTLKKLLINYYNKGFKKENEEYAEEINYLINDRNYYDRIFRSQLETKKSEPWYNPALANLEEIIFQLDRTILMYGSIMKREVKNYS